MPLYIGMIMEFTEKEAFFLKTIIKYGHGHVTQTTLQSDLEKVGIEFDEYKQIKKKLLYAGVIGVVYGNVTIENKEAVKYLNSN
jgi:hypothetical protein